MSGHPPNRAFTLRVAARLTAAGWDEVAAELAVHEVMAYGAASAAWGDVAPHAAAEARATWDALAVAVQEVWAHVHTAVAQVMPAVDEYVTEYAADGVVLLEMEQEWWP